MSRLAVQARPTAQGPALNLALGLGLHCPIHDTGSDALSGVGAQETCGRCGSSPVVKLTPPCYAVCRPAGERIRLFKFCEADPPHAASSPAVAARPGIKGCRCDAVGGRLGGQQAQLLPSAVSACTAMRGFRRWFGGASGLSYSHPTETTASSHPRLPHVCRMCCMRWASGRQIAPSSRRSGFGIMRSDQQGGWCETPW